MDVKNPDEEAEKANNRQHLEKQTDMEVLAPDQMSECVPVELSDGALLLFAASGGRITAVVI